MRPSKVFLNLSLFIAVAAPAFSAEIASSKIEALVNPHLESLNDSKGKVAIFPLNTSAELEARRAGFAMSELISRKILEMSSVKLIDTGVVRKSQEEMGIQWGAGISSKLALAVGHDVGAESVLIGNMVKSGDLLQVNTQLIQVKNKKKKSAGFEELAFSSFESVAGHYLVDPPKENKQTVQGEAYRPSEKPEGKKVAGLIGVELYMGKVNFSDSSQFEDETAPTGTLRVWLHERITLDFSVNHMGEISVKEKLDGLYEGRLNSQIYMGGLSYRHDKGQRVVPSIGGGLAFYSMKYDVGQEYDQGYSYPLSYFGHYEQSIENTNGYYLDLNLAFYFTQKRNWGLFLDGRYIKAETQSSWKESGYLYDYVTYDSYYFEAQGEETIDLGATILSVGIGYHF